MAGIGAGIVLQDNATGAQSEMHQVRMMGEIARLIVGSGGLLDRTDYDRTVKPLLSGGSDPVISKEHCGATTDVITKGNM